MNWFRTWLQDAPCIASEYHSNEDVAKQTAIAALEEVLKHRSGIGNTSNLFVPVEDVEAMIKELKES